MHPEILRQLTEQRGREMRAQAGRARLARMAIRGRRHGHQLPDDDFAVPAIPDYVDGSFRTEPASTLPADTAPADTAHADTAPAGTGPAAEQVSGEAPAARHAA
jgi:hypothetical protein